MHYVQYLYTGVVEPLLSSPLLSGQRLFGGQLPSPGKMSAIRCNKNLCSTANFIIQPRSASCHPKVDLFWFYTSVKWPGKVEVDQIKVKE